MIKALKMHSMNTDSTSEEKKRSKREDRAEEARKKPTVRYEQYTLGGCQ